MRKNTPKTSKGSTPSQPTKAERNFAEAFKVTPSAQQFKHSRQLWQLVNDKSMPPVLSDLLHELMFAAASHYQVFWKGKHQMPLYLPYLLARLAKDGHRFGSGSYTWDDSVREVMNDAAEDTAESLIELLTNPVTPRSIIEKTTDAIYDAAKDAGVSIHTPDVLRAAWPLIVERLEASTQAAPE